MSNTYQLEASPLSDNGGFSELTPREQEVCRLIAKGFTNDEIGQQLVLTTGTVANHVAHILAKLGVNSRVHVALRFANQHDTHSAEEVLELLARLQEVGPTNLAGALQHATDILAAVFAADKVDAFLYQPDEELFVAFGTSSTPLGQRQHALGLHRLAASRAGRVSWIFAEGRPFRDGHVENDRFELEAVRRDLGIRSTIGVPLEISLEQRGVLLVCSVEPDRFGDAELQLLQFVAYWIGLVAQRHASPSRPPGGSLVPPNGYRHR